MFLSLVCVLALAACGGGGKDGGTVEAPDLNQYYEDFMATLGEDNTPAMMDLEAEQIASYYPGLETYGAKQLVLKAAAITAVPYEFALVELADEANAQAVADIFQARIDAQVEGGYRIRGLCSTALASTSLCICPLESLPAAFFLCSKSPTLCSSPSISPASTRRILAKYFRFS